MNKPPSRRERDKRFFAVASLGKNRWYWVVWPSLAMLESGQAEGHLAAGYETAKAEAVDRALELAGWNGEWVAARYASEHQRRLARQARGEAPTPSNIAVMDFLFQDIWDEEAGGWYSIPHRVVRKTKRYLYVEQRPYDPEQRSGSWLDHDDRTFRLDRHMLETEGYTLAPNIEIDDPLFFTQPYADRSILSETSSPDCFARLQLTYPCTVEDVRAAYRRLARQAHPDQGGSHEEFLALRAAYEQALRLCQK